MGINGLNKAIKDLASKCVKEVRPEELPQGTYGVDVSIYLHPSKFNSDQKGKGSHVRSFLEMIIRWRQAGHKLIMVFDGDSSDQKAHELEKRKAVRDQKIQRMIDISIRIIPTVPEHIREKYDLKLSPEYYEGECVKCEQLCNELSSFRCEHCENIYCDDHNTDEHLCHCDQENALVTARKLLKLSFGNFEERLELESVVRNTIELKTSDFEELEHLFDLTSTQYVRANGEADHLLALMYKEQKIIGVISEDSDMLTHGVSNLVRGLIDASCRRKGVVRVYDLPTLLEEFQLTRDEFVDLCILSGCDYCEKLPGIACRTGLKLLRKHGNIEAVVKYLMEKSKITEDKSTEFLSKITTVRELFKNHDREAIYDLSEEQIINREELREWLTHTTNYREETLDKKLTELCEN